MGEYNKKCLRTFVKKDALGWPQVGEAMSYNPYEQLPCDAICDMIELVPNQVQPDGTHICIHPEGRRFFFRVTRQDPKQVLRGSLMSAYEFPTTPTDGCWREWHKYCAN